jgi:hypothetical protein
VTVVVNEKNVFISLGGRLEGRSSHEPCLPCGATGQRRDRSLPANNDVAFYCELAGFSAGYETFPN